MKEKDFERRDGKEPRDTLPPPPPPSPTPDGEISKAMGIDTKPAHKLEVNGYWVLVDPKAPTDLVNDLKAFTAFKKAYDEEVFQNNHLRAELKEASRQLKKQSELVTKLELQLGFYGKEAMVIDKKHPHFGATAICEGAYLTAIGWRMKFKNTNSSESFYVENGSQIKWIQ